jgi:predicted nucleotidyltransferase
LHALLAKTAGLAGVLQSALAPHTAHIECAFVYGSAARGAEAAESDVDLMIIGSVTLLALSTALATAERELRRPVEPSVYGVADFAHKVASTNPFVRRVLNGDRLFVVGTERDLERLAQGGASRAAPARARRNRGTKKRR